MYVLTGSHNLLLEVTDFYPSLKNPKMYFYDTGLVSALLGITSAEQLETFYMRGALFENFVVSELLKKRLFAGKSDELYFWRDSNGVEIDVIEEDNLEIKAYEIKASETMNTAFFSNIKKIKEIAGLKAENTAILNTSLLFRPVELIISFL